MFSGGRKNVNDEQRSGRPSILTDVVSVLGSKRHNFGRISEKGDQPMLIV